MTSTRIRPRSRFLLDWDADWCLSQIRQALNAVTDQVATFTRSTTTTAVDGAGNPRMYADSEAAFEWRDTDGNGVLEPLLLLGTTDRLYLGYLGKPGERTYYAGFVEHTPTGSQVGTRVWEIGDAGSAGGSLSVRRTASGYEAVHTGPSGSVTGSVPITVLSGDWVQLRVVIAVDGKVTVSVAKNYGTEVEGSPSAATALASSWNQPRWAIGSDYSGNNRATQSLRVLREYKGVQTLAFMSDQGGVSSPPTPAASLSMVTQPSSTLANAGTLAVQPSVQLSTGNAGVLVSVSLIGNGVLSGALTALSDANGLATFTGLGITGLVGTYFLVFTAPGYTSETSSVITLSPGTAVKAGMRVNPAGAATGVAFTTQAVVELQDVSGNAVGTGTINVVATLQSGSGTLGGTNTVACVAGVATFTTQQITGDGPHTILYTPTALTGVVSTVITVFSPATATALEMETQPVGGGINDPLPTQPRVRLVIPAVPYVFSGAPVPSQQILRMYLSKVSHIRIANGGDEWASTWADDDLIYMGCSDGYWDGTTPSLQGHEVVALTGLPTAVATGQGTVVNTKTNVLCVGLISIAGVLYRTEEDRVTVVRTRIGKSVDHGVNWTYLVDPVTGWTYDRTTEGDYRGSITFVQGGQDYATSYDDAYVYWVSESGAGACYLGRCLKTDDLRDTTKHLWFNGSVAIPSWVAGISNATPILTVTSAQLFILNWNPVLNRFLLCHGYAGSDGRLRLLESPTPFGPFTEVFHSQVFDDDTQGKLFAQMVNKTGWLSADGKTWWMILSGAGGGSGWDSFNVIKCTLETVAPAYETDFPSDQNPLSEGGVWEGTTGEAMLQVQGGTARCITVPVGQMLVGAAGFPSPGIEQYAEATILQGGAGTGANHGYPGVGVCIQPDGSGYFAFAETGVVALYILDAVGGYTIIGSSALHTCGSLVANELRIERDADDTTLRVLANRIILVEETEGTLTLGRPGANLEALGSLANAQLTNFRCGPGVALTLPDENPLSDGAKWDTTPGVSPLAVSGGNIVASVPTEVCYQRVNEVGLPLASSNQRSKASFAAGTTGAINVTLRDQGDGNLYRFGGSPLDNTVGLFRQYASSPPVFLGSIAHTFVAGTTTLELRGQGGLLFPLVDGVLAFTPTVESIPLAGGRPGLMLYGDAEAGADYEAGSLSVNVAQAGVTITAAKDSGPGTLSGDVTKDTDAAGIADFTDLEFDTAGTCVLEFTSPGLDPVLSGPITVIGSGVATQLVMVQQPGGALEGIPLSPQPRVQRRDAANNPVLTAGVTITASKASGPGTLSGDTTKQTDAFGVADFTDLELDTDGTYTLLFTETALTKASDPFVVTPTGGGTPGAWLGRRPPSYATFIDYPFSVSWPGGFNDRSVGDGSGFGITGNPLQVADASDPVSPTGCIQWTYPVGSGTPADSFSAGKIYHSMNPAISEWYFAFMVWHDANFEWNPVSNKLLMIFGDNSDIALQSKHNSTYWNVIDQKHDVSYDPNIAPGTNPTGVWVQYEVMFRLGAGGYLLVWIDGVSIMQRTGTNFINFAGEFALDGTWGGGNGPTTRTSFRRIGHLHVAHP